MTKWGVLLCLLLAGPASAQDAIDLSQASIHFGSPADIASWPITTSIQQVRFDGGGVTVTFDAASRWPDVTPPGWTGPLQYTIWLFVQVDGRWHGAGVVEMWRGRGSTGSYTQSTLAQHLTENWVRDGHWGLTPTIVDGETVGLMVSAGDARGKDVHAIRERSNVVLAQVKNFAAYSYTAAPPAPVPTTPPTPTPTPPPVVTPPPAPLPTTVCPAIDLTPVSAQLAQCLTLTQQIEAEVKAHAEADAAFQAQVKSVWDSFGKPFMTYVILPLGTAITTYLSTR